MLFSSCGLFFDFPALVRSSKHIGTEKSFGSSAKTKIKTALGSRGGFETRGSLPNKLEEINTVNTARRVLLADFYQKFISINSSFEAQQDSKPPGRWYSKEVAPATLEAAT